MLIVSNVRSGTEEDCRLERCLKLPRLDDEGEADADAAKTPSSRMSDEGGRRASLASILMERMFVQDRRMDRRTTLGCGHALPLRSAFLRSDVGCAHRHPISQLCLRAASSSVPGLFDHRSRLSHQSPPSLTRRAQPQKGVAPPPLLSAQRAVERPKQRRPGRESSNSHPRHLFVQSGTSSIQYTYVCGPNLASRDLVLGSCSSTSVTTEVRSRMPPICSYVDLPCFVPARPDWAEVGVPCGVMDGRR